MLTYNFSPREKTMLAILAFVGIAVAWFQFVFVPFQNQIDQLDEQIATVQDEITLSKSRAAALKDMQKKVEEYKAQGIEPILLPTYDNTKSLMAYLNSVLGTASDFSMSFKSPELSEEDNLVHRSGTITFNTNDYKEARQIAQSIARGPYPCQVDALGITNGKVATSGASAKGWNDRMVTTMQVTFLEKPSKEMKASSKSKTKEGQDLSKMSDWDK